MATRVNRKTANTASPKEIVAVDKSNKEVTDDSNTGVNKSTAKATPIGKRLAKRAATKLVKKPSIAIKLKAKAKKTRKINTKLTKSLLQNAKTIEDKKKILKNGVKEGKPVKRKAAVKKEKYDAPPVLEPIFPLEENVETKKQPKKRAKKLAEIPDIAPDLVDVKKIKVEDDDLSLSSDVTDISSTEIPSLKKQVKKRAAKKVKVENETIEDVMNDLSYLIKKEDIKTETYCMPETGKGDVKLKKLTKKQKMELMQNDGLDEALNNFPLLIKKEEIKTEVDTTSESGKSEITKPKKLTKKQKLELLKSKIIKKENIENTLNKLDPSQEKVIDMLDLNVRNIKRKSSLAKRRHSIEKCPIGTIEPSVSPITQLLFSQLPRSISPRSKRSTKARQSIDSLGRRSSLYSTRSDSPGRMLRNGKQRTLKDKTLSDGLESDTKKRKKNSDLSGNDYESDSSFSDLASLGGADTTDTEPSTKTNVDNVEAKSVDTAQNGPVSNIGIVDTNSNVCNNLNEKLVSKTESLVVTETFSNLPQKKALLDIMKQTFNESVSESTISNSDVTKSNFEPFLTTTFYGRDRNDLTEENVPENSAKSVPEDLIPEENVAFVSNNPETTADINTLDKEPEADLNKTEFTEDLPIPAISEDNVQTDIIPDKIDDMITAISPPDMADISTNMEINGLEAVVKTIISDLDKKSNSDQDEEMEMLESVDFKENEEDVTDLEPPILEKENVTDPVIPSEEPLAPQIEEPLSEEMIEEPQTVEEPSTLQNVVEEDVDIVGITEMETNSLTEQKDEVTEHDDVETNLEVSDINRTETDNTNVEDNIEDNIGNYNIEESAEDLAEKESILKALGLQSLRAAEQAKLKSSRGRSSKGADSYTGTLKTVIKINRDKKKGGKSKITLQKNKSKTTEEEQVPIEEKIIKDVLPSTSKQGSHSSDTAGAHRKSHYSNRSNLDGSSEHTSDGEGTNQDGTIKALVIPEKASSFSIHPGRLCKDECSYCFGKFGLFDTPCHIAQMKSVERQDKILAAEKHLTRDSCLCDACYRHVDRKSNTPSYMNKSLKRSSLVAPGPKQNHCHVLGCNTVSTNILRRKWIIKMKKSICQVINIDLDNPGLHSIPICSEHYAALEHLMVCAMCKRRLARNHVHYLGSEVAALNEALNKADVPLNLSSRPVVCKLCKCFASIVLKEAEERGENSVSFFNEYKRRLLHFNDIVPMDEAAAEEPIAVPTKPEKLDQLKKKKKPSKSTDSESQESPASPEKIQERVPSTDTTSSPPRSRSESPSDDYNGVDYNTLIPAIAMECDSDTDSRKDGKKTPIIFKKMDKSMILPESVEISKVIKPQHDKCKSSDIAVQKLGANPSISVRQLFPGEEDLPLNVHVDFNNIKDRTPEGWEKCSSVIQYDAETRKLWQELQKPYGNQSSFLRHLILLEKYFRNGDLVLSPRASHHSINYSESVHNRLRAYDNIPTSAGNIQPLTMMQFNKMQNRSSSGIITSGNGITLNPIPSISQSTTITSIPKPILNPVTITSTNTHNPPKAPLTISQLNSPPLIPAPKTILEGKLTEPSPLLQVRPKLSAPPGLISLHQGTARPVAPLLKMPQSQKIKFPITKNWRPNLIPIDPNKKQERKAGLVQVISGGKPYHITLEDYKKMCAIKRSFEMKQKRLQEAQTNKPILVTHNSVLKSIIPRKGLIISKTPVKHDLIPPPSSTESNGDGENILDKLDKQVEKLESKLNEKSSQLLLPKIPKSLTVIPQTVTKKPSRPTSPALQITPKTVSKS